MRSKKKNFKYWIGRLHLWLGLASGIIVFVVAITGCLFCFQKEISDWNYKKVFFIAPRNTTTLPLSTLQAKAQEVLGADQPLSYIITYKEPGRAWEFMTYRLNDTAFTYFGAVEYFRSVYINPYDGTVTGIRDYKYDFFNVVKYLHWSLLLNTKYGQPIVGWATFIFVILLITGLILWWPKRWKKAYKDRSFKIKWKASIKRLNYDLHNVLGFYSLLLALVIALTGMVWSFRWFMTIVYVVASGTTTAPEDPTVKSIIPQHNISVTAIDSTFRKIQKQHPEADRIGVTPPFGSEGIIYISAYRGKEIYYDRDDYLFDQYNGKLLHTILTKEKNAGVKLIEMNFDIHVGAIGGIWGKIIAFVISLICGSLPVTGFYVWWFRRHKKRNIR